MKEFSLIIPTKDRGAIFLKTLEHAFEASKNYDAEIIVVNDSSNPVIIPGKFSNVIVVDNPKKNSVASARNYGFSFSKSDFIIFLDDDVIINAAALKEIIDFYSKKKDAILNLNWTYPPELKQRISKTQFGRFLIHFKLDSMKGWRQGLVWNDNELFESESVANYLLPISREMFKSFGGYNENFPFAGGEDHDLSVKLKNKGVKFFIEPNVTVYHNEEDRTELKNWLERKRRSGITYKTAQQLGYSEFMMNYTRFQKLVLSFIISIKPLLFFVLKLIPNISTFDKVYFKLVNALLAASIYDGYTKN